MADNISITPDALEFEHANYQRLAKRLNFPFYIKDDYVYWIRPSHKHYEENHEANYVESVLWETIISGVDLNYLHTKEKEFHHSLQNIPDGTVFFSSEENNIFEYIEDFNISQQREKINGIWYTSYTTMTTIKETPQRKVIHTLYCSPFIRTGYYYSPKESDPNFESIKNKLLFGKDISEFSEEEIKILKRDQKPFGID